MSTIAGSLLNSWSGSKQTRANTLAQGGQQQAIFHEIIRRMIVGNTPFIGSIPWQTLQEGGYGPGLSGQSQNILRSIIQQNTGPAPGQEAAQNLVNDILGGKYLYGGPNQDPALTKAMNTAAAIYADQQSQARARFQTSAQGATGGTYGSGAYLPEAARFESMIGLPASNALAKLALNY